jgi:coenzyme PQQ precursor peptide PqqA
MKAIGACFLSLIAMKRIGGRLIYKQRPVSLDGIVSFCPCAGLWRNAMAWTTPTLVEICIGLEINGYLPAEF